MITVSALALAAGVVGAGIAAADPTTTPSPTPSGPAPGPTTSATPSPSPDAAAPTEPKTTIDSDGTYKVGVDIVPGTYSTPGPIEGGACYWKRTGGPDGQTKVDNALTKKPAVVQIDPGDTEFKTDGCQPWTMTDTPPPPAAGPLLSQLQLRHALDTLNGMAGASGQGQLPPY